MALPPIVATLSDKMMQFISCPISQDVMQDPVCTPDGNTYDRSHIVEWINRNHTCPLTRTRLQINDLVPNKSLKGVINGYIKSGRLPPFPVEVSIPVKPNGTVRLPSISPPVQRSAGTLIHPFQRAAGTLIHPFQRAEATFNTGQLESVDYHSNPNFDFIQDLHSRRMVSSAYNVVQNMGEWDFLRRYSPSVDTGYMADRNARIWAISKKIDDEYQGHSGASMAYTMRIIEFIAKYGFNAYKQSYLRL